MGLLTLIGGDPKKRVLKAQDNIVKMIEERQRIAEELDVLEAEKRESEALQKDKEKLRRLKNEKWIGWLK